MASVTAIRRAATVGLTAVALAAGALLPAHPATARERPNPAHNDVLFVGAHPDDESGALSTLGQWGESSGRSAGVVTITRGEGGGNAAGTEEGAPLGLIREREERAAVGIAGVRNVFALDKADFWYTLSAPLTAGVWDDADSTDTLERLVRLIRATTPDTVVTMDPRPFDQHGGHQLSARLTAEAFQLAGDPSAFPGQLSEEGYEAWRPDTLLAQNWGFDGPAGRECAREKATDPATGLPVRGYWEGTWSKRHGSTWAQAERDAQRKYVTQGFDAQPEKITTPREKLGCDWFTVLAEDGEPVPSEARSQSGLRPVYAEFRDWAHRVEMPWLANEAQPDYPEPPSTTVPEVNTAPTVDGSGSADEYPGEELELGHWQGESCESSADCSASAKLARHGHDLYALVRVEDEQRGAALDSGDCKRHWRTDAVELALDPRGDADSTAPTYKIGVLPLTSDGDGGPCVTRDADNHQGPAPGVEVASQSEDPYSGYTVEVRVPLTELPAAADPERLSANVMVYDSDTGDRTGQSRLAWSSFGSAQADPYTWGTARLSGYRPPEGQPTTPREPEIPREAARSRDSLPSILQSLRTGVPLAGGPRLPR
ncbi:hypothetical protein E0L36_11880 [Streptomyces sp. AJS327]|uniref:sugar-binding protein n=1 Tax=Streptomyces sp. AJS327 TaxID=2545265 RepID=UPI0015DFFD66|nr:sugar-binding protein [Streptomyces sp. AJS327]MBA0051568.1 hypothetical protein [Streptomyces sp. AJS327]